MSDSFPKPPEGPLQIELEHFHLQPFQTLNGQIRVTGPVDAKSLELRLFWFTRGRGDEDACIIERLSLDVAAPETAFSWKLPDGPYSFAGQLISLAWAVEIVDNREKSLELVPFQLSPTGAEIQLAVVEDKNSKGELAKRFAKRKR